MLTQANLNLKLMFSNLLASLPIPIHHSLTWYCFGNADKLDFVVRHALSKIQIIAFPRNVSNYWAFNGTKLSTNILYVLWPNSWAPESCFKNSKTSDKRNQLFLLFSRDKF